MTKKKKENPAKQGKGKGRIPPVENRWKPGQSGNPSGRKCAGLTLKEWFNQMADWSKAQLRATFDDPEASVAKISAARCWLHASSEMTTNSGSPIAGPEVDRILDRTIGKPTQAVDLTSKGEKITPTMDLSKLTVEELASLESIVRKSESAGSAGDAPADPSGES